MAIVGYIRSAELVDPTTEMGRVAALNSSVVAALAALADTKVTVAGGDLITRAAELRTKFIAHIDVAAWHSDADVLNAPVRGAPASIADAIATVNELRVRFDGHARQSAQGGGWHGSDDTLTPVVVAQAFSLGQAQVLLSHLRALYEMHRVRGSGVGVHANAGGDTTNTLSAATELDTAIASYLSALSASAPTAPTGEGQGATDASHRYGFAIRRP